MNQNTEPIFELLDLFYEQTKYLKGLNLGFDCLLQERRERDPSFQARYTQILNASPSSLETPASKKPLTATVYDALLKRIAAVRERVEKEDEGSMGLEETDE
jgi:hypothetical protein